MAEVSRAHLLYRLRKASDHRAQLLAAIENGVRPSELLELADGIRDEIGLPVKQGSAK